ncbi:MAG TPA: hypothetical protein VF950_27150 [Planctomycetota bacterium]
MIALTLLLQLTPGAPEERVWPISGTLARPDGTELRISASRVERRWDVRAGRFREELSVESRASAGALVERKAFLARLRKGPAGIYQVAVREEDREALDERVPLGPPGDLPASWASAPEKLTASRDRLQEFVKVARKVARGELPATADQQKAWSKGLGNEERILAELALKSDFTATAAVLGRVGMLLRNAQLWGARPADDGDGAFLEDDVNFETLDKTLAAVPALVAAELKASVASLLALLTARAADKPKLLAALHDAARKAVGPLQGAAPDFLEAVEATSQAGVDDLPELRKRLEAFRDALVEAPSK